MSHLRIVLIIFLLIGFGFGQEQDTIRMEELDIAKIEEIAKADARLDIGMDGVSVGISDVGDLTVISMLFQPGIILGFLGRYRMVRRQRVPYKRIEDLEKALESAAYVSIYRTAYESEARRILTRNVLVGNIVGCFGLLSIIFILSYYLGQ